MKSIAFICKFSWVGISTSVINSALFWESKGYSVDIYTENPDQEKFPLPDFTEKNINIIATNIINIPIIDDVSFRIKYFKKKNYEWVIGFDYTGLIRGGFSTLFTKSKLIYHSLEFFELQKLSKRNSIYYILIFIYFILFKAFEILFSFKAKYIFSQDNYRIQFLKTNLKQNINKFKIIYNTPIEEIELKKSDYFRKLFNIPESEKIVLCIGTLIKEHYIIELVNSINSWENQFVLILHGWFPYNDVKEIVLNKKREFPEKIFISEYFFKNKEKHIPFQACDIGFVGFKMINNNTKYAAGAAGKTFDFMQSGKPIIAHNTPGMKEIIETNNIGKVFDSTKEINNLLKIILLEYDQLSSNTKIAFRKYDFFEQYNFVFQSL